MDKHQTILIANDGTIGDSDLAMEDTLKFGIFGSSKTYLQRNPSAKAVYQSLTEEQKKILDNISMLEQKHGSDDEKSALIRIIDVYLIKELNANPKNVKSQAKVIYSNLIGWLKNSELTTNVNTSLFINDSFLNGDSVKTIFNAKNRKNLELYTDTSCGRRTRLWVHY